MPDKQTAKKPKKQREPAPGTALDSFDKKRREDLIEQFAKAEKTLEDAIDAMNAAMDLKRRAVESALDAYNGVIADANSWQEDIACSIRDFIDGHAEKWHESAKGHAYAEWLREFEDQFDEAYIEIPETISYSLENMEELMRLRNEAPADI